MIISIKFRNKENLNNKIMNHEKKHKKVNNMKKPVFIKISNDERIRKFITHELACLRASEENGSDRYDELTIAIDYLEKQGDIVKHYEDKLDKCACDNFNKGYKKALEKQDQHKETNLVEILKHYPRETELYSPLYGKLWLAKVDEKHEIIICYKHRLDEGCTRAILEQEDTVSFYSNGTTGLPDFSISKYCMLFLYDSEKRGEQKSIWSEENSCYYDDICEILINLVNTPKSKINKDAIQKDLDWLISLKDRVLPQPKQEQKSVDKAEPKSPSVIEEKSAWSEEDEEMIDAVIADIQFTQKAHNHEVNQIVYEREIDWLKSLKDRVLPQPKQEQKSVDKVESKFNVGDWITNGKLLVGQVTSFDGEYYHYVCNGIEQPLHISNAHKWHLWTIQDAKDGDVLVFDDIIMIFKNIKTACTANTYILYCNGDGIVVDDWCDFGPDAQPATKEQRDLLFQKMKEAGYEWDVEKKELKKIEKNSAWSEEDESIFTDIISNIHYAEKHRFVTGSRDSENEQINWFKSLKDRIQPNQEWSEKDEKMFKSALWHVKNSCGKEGNVYNWLKSIKERII